MQDIIPKYWILITKVTIWTKTGHSAKYGSYTMMDLHTNTVVDIYLVQVSCQNWFCKGVIGYNFKSKVYNAFSVIILFFCVNRATRLVVAATWKKRAWQGVCITGVAWRQPWLHCHWLSSTSTEVPQERNITHYYDVWHMAKGIFSVPIWSWLTSIVHYTIQNLSVLLQPFPFFELLVISFWWEGSDVRFFLKLA